MKPILRALLPVLAIGPTLAACAVSTNPVSGNRRAYGYTWEQEIQLGRQADEEIVEQFGVYHDPELEDYVRRVGEQVLAQSHLRRQTALPEYQRTKFTFRILDTEIVNAFALPGGFVYVTRGLLARGLVRGKSYAVGVVVPDLSNPFFLDVVRGIERVAAEAGCRRLILFHYEPEHDDATMDWPQSRERVRGAENRRAIYQAFPQLPTITPRQPIRSSSSRSSSPPGSSASTRPRRSVTPSRRSRSASKPGGIRTWATCRAGWRNTGAASTRPVRPSVPTQDTDQSLSTLMPGAVLSLGRTGLRVSGVVPTAAGWTALRSAGGHASFSPVDATEIAILRFARREFGDVSAERLPPFAVDRLRYEAGLQEFLARASAAELLAPVSLRFAAS